jgi:hypothetical protein
MDYRNYKLQEELNHYKMELKLWKFKYDLLSMRINNL